MSIIKIISENAKSGTPIGEVKISAEDKKAIVAAFEEENSVKLTAKQQKNLMAAFVGVIAVNNLSMVFQKGTAGKNASDLL